MVMGSFKPGDPNTCIPYTAYTAAWMTIFFYKQVFFHFHVHSWEYSSVLEHSTAPPSMPSRSILLGARHIGRHQRRGDLEPVSLVNRECGGMK